MKQPYEKKAAKLKEKYDKVRLSSGETISSICRRAYLIKQIFFTTQDIAVYRTKGVAGLSKKAAGEDDEEEEDDDEEDEDEEEEDDD